MRAPPPWLKQPPEALPPNTVALENRFKHRNFGRTQNSVYSKGWTRQEGKYDEQLREYRLKSIKTGGLYNRPIKRSWNSENELWPWTWAKGHEACAPILLLSLSLSSLGLSARYPLVSIWLWESFSTSLSCFCRYEENNSCYLSTL